MKMSTKDILANRVRIVRLARGYSQAQLAEMVGYTSRASINKIEKGLVDIPRSKLFALADALHVSPAFLLGLPEGSPVEYDEKDFRFTYRDGVLYAFQMKPSKELLLTKLHWMRCPVHRRGNLLMK